MDEIAKFSSNGEYINPILLFTIAADHGQRHQQGINFASDLDSSSTASLGFLRSRYALFMGTLCRISMFVIACAV